MDHGLDLRHSFYVVSRCICGGLVMVGRVDKPRRSGEPWSAYDQRGELAGRTSDLIDAERLIIERSEHKA